MSRTGATDTLQAYTTKELKEQLTQLGLSTKGNKTRLIERLQKARATGDDRTQDLGSDNEVGGDPGERGAAPDRVQVEIDEAERRIRLLELQARERQLRQEAQTAGGAQPRRAALSSSSENLEKKIFDKMNRKATDRASNAWREPRTQSTECSSNGQAVLDCDVESLPKFWQHPWLPIVLTFLCYSPNLLIYADDNETWVYDDHSSVRSNPCVIGVDSMNKSVPWTCIFWADYWGIPMSSNMSHKSYRPITTAFFIAERVVWGFADSRLWHLGNVATKALATWLFGRVARECLSCQESAIYATLLFAVHPIHTESVSNITGQAESLSAVFMLLAFLAYRRQPGPAVINFLVSVLAAFAAMLCKEPGFSALAVICVHIASQELRAVKAAAVKQRDAADDASSECRMTWKDIRCVRTRVWLQLLGYCTAGCAIFAGRCWIQTERPQFNSFMNPGAFHHSRLTRGLTMTHYAVTHASLLIAPVTLCPDYSNSAIPELETLFDQRCLPMFAAAVGLTWATIALVRAALDARRDVHEVTVCAVWLVMPFLPVSNLFFAVGFAVAERILFAPSIGLCLLAGLGIRWLSEALSQAANDHTRARLLSGLHKSLRCLLILLAVRTALRDLDWNTSRSLWASSYKACAPNANVLRNLAIAEPHNQTFQRFLFERATAVGRPFSPDHSVGSLAQLLERMGRFREMLELCRGSGSPHMAMCSAAAKQHLRRYSEAAADYARVYKSMNDSHWQRSDSHRDREFRISRADVVMSYARSLALSGSEAAEHVIAEHAPSMPEPIQYHLMVSTALLSARLNRTGNFTDAVARLAACPEVGPALTDLATELRDVGLYRDSLTALDALPPHARQAPIVPFLRLSAQDGLYTESERFAARERDMLGNLTGLDPPNVLDALADIADRVAQTDLADSAFELLHACRFLVQPIEAVHRRFGPGKLGPGMMEVRGLFAGGNRGDLAMHPRLLTDREKIGILLGDLRRLAREVRLDVGTDGADWGDWGMLPTKEFFASFTGEE